MSEDGDMGKQKRSADDIRRLVKEFEGSGLTRREFCQRQHIAVTTLDYWRRTHSRPARLIEVEMAANEPTPRFILSLANGTVRKKMAESQPKRWAAVKKAATK